MQLKAGRYADKIKTGSARLSGGCWLVKVKVFCWMTTKLVLDRGMFAS